MSFYSLLVRDHKRKWKILFDSPDENTILNARMNVLADPDYRCQILKTDGNTRNIQLGLEEVRLANGRGLSTIFGFSRIV